MWISGISSFFEDVRRHIFAWCSPFSDYFLSNFSSNQIDCMYLLEPLHLGISTVLTPGEHFKQ